MGIRVDAIGDRFLVIIIFMLLFLFYLFLALLFFILYSPVTFFPQYFLTLSSFSYYLSVCVFCPTVIFYSSSPTLPHRLSLRLLPSSILSLSLCTSHPIFFISLLFIHCHFTSPYYVPSRVLVYSSCPIVHHFPIYLFSSFCLAFHFPPYFFYFPALYALSFT